LPDGEPPNRRLTPGGKPYHCSSCYNLSDGRIAEWMSRIFKSVL
jgi:hypothetical protein